MDETLELTAEAERLGAAAALVVTPYYGRAQQEGLFRWYSRVANEFPDLPIIVYNVPVRAAVDIAPETVGRLRRAHENIVGIKETTRDFEHVSYVLHEAGQRLHRALGHRAALLPDALPRRRGHLSCVGNFAPRPVAELYDAFVAGDHERARALHYDLHPLVDAAFAETNPVPAKWIMKESACLPPGRAASRSRRSAPPRRSASAPSLRRARASSCQPPSARSGGACFVLLTPRAEAFDRLQLVCPRLRLDSIGARPAGDELDELSVLRDRLRPAIRDVREHRPPDGIQPPLDLAQHLDQCRVRAALVEDLVELAVVTPEREGVPFVPSRWPCRPSPGAGE